MSEEKRIKELEQEIAELKAFIFQMKPTINVSPARRLQQIRQDYRDKYFGTWDELKNGQVTYGPNGKTYSDYSAITEIINKSTGLIFKYSRGKTGTGEVYKLVSTAKDLDDYEQICDVVCRDLREKFDTYTREEEIHAGNDR